VSYSIDIDPAAQDTISSRPPRALIPLAEAPAMVEPTPWSGRSGNPERDPDAAVRNPLRGRWNDHPPHPRPRSACRRPARHLAVAPRADTEPGVTLPPTTAPAILHLVETHPCRSPLTMEPTSEEGLS